MDFVEKIKTELSNVYSKQELGSVVSLIFNKLAGINLTEILLLDNKKLSEKVMQKIESAVERLKLNEPIQYVLGQTEFYGLPFITDNRALIPRPETEELVDLILCNCGLDEKPVEILDIGTGSGCIAVTLAQKLKNAQVSAFDISLDALNLAHENAELNNVFVKFYHQNILKITDFEQKFDVIVSNPPYVTEEEKEFIKPNVLDFEPHIALFVSNSEPLIFYDYISKFAKNHLKPNGKLYFEINQNFGKNIVKLLKINGFKNVELKKDISGKDRFVLGNI
ncbi:MAG: peptide chain release factor N(5)-glutamine methyltransferase [Prevotellaceae bacterium]|jgi:release factor glutamine methyltransferase|nr:peptide chain release factor N(5)-glutamine methyltransferase [Prevotellaceae bacterium]